MPLYEYQCQDCQSVFKERKPFARSGETAVCPTCESIQTQKVIGAVAFIGNGRLPTQDRSIPLNMSSGGCGCGGSCACGGH
jgi:putative FmdB family regulatory protein